jgi:hypothetical protein
MTLERSSFALTGLPAEEPQAPRVEQVDQPGQNNGRNSFPSTRTGDTPDEVRRLTVPCGDT